MATWKQVGAALVGGWPARSWDAEGVAAYVAELQARGLGADGALTALRASSGDFPPSVGAVAALAERLAQGPAPSFEVAQRAIAQRITLLAYHRPSEGFDRLVAAVSAEHEAIGRLALALGPQGCRELPDPAHAHGAQVQAARRSLGEAVREWEEDPRRGVAAGEARRRVGAAERPALSA